MKPRKVKISMIFLLAAQRIANKPKNLFHAHRGYSGCCGAIYSAAHTLRMDDETDIKAAVYFADLFRPEGMTPGEFWWADVYQSESPDEQEARRLALLFAYQMAKDEGL